VNGGHARIALASYYGIDGLGYGRPSRSKASQRARGWLGASAEAHAVPEWGEELHVEASLAAVEFLGMLGGIGSVGVDLVAAKAIDHALPDTPRVQSSTLSAGASVESLHFIHRHP
jgi:hypothetical protein